MQYPIDTVHSELLESLGVLSEVFMVVSILDSARWVGARQLKGSGLAHSDIDGAAVKLEVRRLVDEGASLSWRCQEEINIKQNWWVHGNAYLGVGASGGRVPEWWTEVDYTESGRYG